MKIFYQGKKYKGYIYRVKVHSKHVTSTGKLFLLALVVYILQRYVLKITVLKLQEDDLDYDYLSLYRQDSFLMIYHTTACWCWSCSSVTKKAWNPYGTLTGSSTTATGSEDMVFASITLTSDFPVFSSCTKNIK